MARETSDFDWSKRVVSYYENRMEEGELPMLSDTDLYLMTGDDKQELVELGYMLTPFNEGVMVHPIPLEADQSGGAI